MSRAAIIIFWLASSKAFAGGGIRCSGETGGLPPKIEVDVTYANQGGGNGKTMNPIGFFGEAVHRSGVERSIGLSCKEFEQKFELDGSWPIGTYAGRDKNGNVGVVSIFGPAKEAGKYRGTYTKVSKDLFIVLNLTCDIIFGG